MKKICGTVGCMLLLTIGSIAAQEPKDTKGWHGATWGMTVDQVKSATGMHLEPTTDGSGGDCKAGTPGATLLKSASTIEVKSLTGTPRFCVTDKDGLVYVNIDFGAADLSFDNIRDELVGTYGTPTSEQRDPPRPPVVTRNATWVLPNTEINLSSFRTMTGKSDDIHSLSLSYSRRKPRIL